MLRLDIFEDIHKFLYDFWKEITYTFGDEYPIVFISSFTSYEESARKMSPELYGLCESYANLQVANFDLSGAQRDIKDKLKGQMVDTNGAHDLIILHPLTKEEEKIKDEFYEINESIINLDRDMENLSKVILKERQKLWNRIDTLIIYSYKQMLYDVTGSDDLVQAFMNETRTLGIMKDLAIAKRKHDYETILDMIGALDSNTGEWISDIEQLVGATE